MVTDKIMELCNREICQWRQRSGIYYVWSDEVKNGRVRMTNDAARVGVRGQVSFWGNVAHIKASGSK